MPIFQIDQSSGAWIPAPIAAGPFAGIQGGAVAGLLVGEMEDRGRREGWGDAVALSVWFLKPTPVRPLRTQLQIVRASRRIVVADNMVIPDDESEPTAMARATFMRATAMDAPGFDPSQACPEGPEQLKIEQREAPHGGPWFMDAMEVRPAEGVTWFRMKDDVVTGGGAMARAVGPADWTHGLARPLQNVLADPNPNLNVHLVRPPLGPWIGIRAATQWQPELGIGLGRGVILDVSGDVGTVSMSVALTPFPQKSLRSGG